MSQSINIAVKSATARLLATENVQVNQTNSQTAWFDVEKRILNLPMWDVEPFVYDMIVGHEVGHALYTPAEGWHDSIKELDIPRSYVNVVEDARIEKLVKRQYPGIVYTFTRAYAWMHEEDFFKVQNRDVYGMKLIDRINLEFKLGASMHVPFTTDELVYVDKVSKCETFEEVVDVCKEILAFWKDNKDEIKEELKQMKLEASDEDGDEGDDEFESEEGEETSASDEVEYTDEDLDDGVDREERATTGSGAGEEDPVDEDEVSETDDAQRKSESRMLNSDTGTIVKMFPEDMALEAMVPYKDYYSKHRVVYYYRSRNTGFDRFAHVDPSPAYIGFVDVEFKRFMNETNKAVSYMAKEFEQKKAAYQYSRAKTSNSGTLNTTALHKYKFSEDVFKRITTLANAKSHGMMISIDMSGSMSDVMLDTVKQALNLALFCRRVNIPFEMYGFTDGRDNINYDDQYERLTKGMMNPGAFRYIQFFSHKMSKREFDNGVKQMFQMASGIMNEYDHLGSTPTNEMLVTLTYLLKRFRKATGVQKMINIMLSDGDPNRSSLKEESAYSLGNSGLLQVSPTKFIKIRNTANDLSEKLLNHIKTECDVTNFGYFLGDNNSFKNAIYRLSEGSYNETQSIKSEIRKTGYATKDNVLGYDRYVVIKGKSFAIEDGEFEVSEDATKSTIAREFAKFTKGKRTSRVLLDRFVQCVA